METQWCEYHSYQWGIMIEDGWITMYTTDIEGQRMARMMRCIRR